jgi:prepilin-type N-terminal cleavage/methylation domain-containing protein
MIFSPRRSSAKHQNGFSLLEAMVGMAVAAVHTYAISQMLVNFGEAGHRHPIEGRFQLVYEPASRRAEQHRHLLGRDQPLQET